MPDRISKTGEVIYGSEILRVTLDALRSMMAAKSTAHAGVDAVVASMEARLVTLYEERSKLADRSDLDLDASYEQVRSLYVELADLLEALGYPGFSPDAFRERAQLMADQSAPLAKPVALAKSVETAGPRETRSSWQRCSAPIEIGSNDTANLHSAWLSQSTVRRLEKERLPYFQREEFPGVNGNRSPPACAQNVSKVGEITVP